MDLFDTDARAHAEHHLQKFLDWYGSGEGKEAFAWLAADVREYFENPYQPPWENLITHRGAERAATTGSRNP